MSEEKNETVEVVTQQDVTEESSTQETQVEEATSQKATEKEPPFHEHPRWKELQDEKRQLKEQNDRYQEQLFQLASSSRQTQPQVEEKVYEANTPEEREFWQKVETIAEKKAEARVKVVIDEVQKKEKVLNDITASIVAKDFLKEHPTVKKGSEELREIVNAARSKNLDLEDAYKLVMFDREKEMAAESARKEKQEQNKKKLAANVERGTVSTEAPINKDGDDFDAVFNREIDSSGLIF